jgi:hypothetical protein
VEDIVSGPHSPFTPSWLIVSARLIPGMVVVCVLDGECEELNLAKNPVGRKEILAWPCQDVLAFEWVLNLAPEPVSLTSNHLNIPVS